MTSRQTLPSDIHNWPIVFIPEADAAQLEPTTMDSRSSGPATALMARQFRDISVSVNRVVIMVPENGLVWGSKTGPLPTNAGYQMNIGSEPLDRK
jgi:hypothetical protein